MEQTRLFIFSTLLLLAGLLWSCDNDDEKVDLPTSALIHYSVVDKQVAFTALTINADSYSWDFGDGQTSTEQNPIHVYEDGGYYTATLTVTGGTGSASNEANLAVDITPYVLLTGGPTAEDGKTWKLSAAHSENDVFANADAEFSVIEGPLPQGVFDLQLGMGEVYADEFTFHFDGTYGHDVKDDGAAFGGLLYQMVLNGGMDIVNAGGADFGLCTARYTPESDATFTYVEAEDFTVSSVYGPEGQLTFSGVSTLDFSGTEFIGFRDFQQKVMIQEISDNSMRLVMFMAASQDALQVNTHALILTFEVVG